MVIECLRNYRDETIANRQIINCEIVFPSHSRRFCFDTTRPSMDANVCARNNIEDRETIEMVPSCIFRDIR